MRGLDAVVLIAAVAFGAVLAVSCTLLGIAIALRLTDRWERWGDDGDGGDEDELDPPLDDVQRVVVIHVPRQDAPGAPREAN
jgi:hypothetical protein